MLDDLMIVYPDSLTRTKQIQDPGPGEYFLRSLTKYLRVQLFFSTVESFYGLGYPGNLLLDSDPWIRRRVPGV